MVGCEAMSQPLTIKDLPAEERPRERLMHYGPPSLSNSELLAIILRTGTARQTAVDTAERLLVSFKDLRGLARASLSELSACRGIGPAKAVQIKAAIELGRRVLAESPVQLPVIKRPDDVFHLVQAAFQDLDREHFKVIHLNTKNQVLKVETVAIGILSSSPVHPREVFKEAVRMSSAALILAHNHPSGDPTPSREDLQLTTRLANAGEIMGIPVIDHVIFGDQRFFSLKEHGQMG